MSDLGILELRIQSTQPHTITAHMGRAAQFAFLQAVKSQKTDLAEHLHDGHGLKPYTVSGLLHPNRPHALTGDIVLGTQGQLRFSCLNAEVFKAIAAWASTAKAIEMNHIQWEVIETHWRKTRSYAEIITKHELASPKDRFAFKFIAPTCFKSMGQYFSMPTPRLVFNNLIDRWHTFSGISVPPDFRHFIEQYIVIDNYRIHNQPVVVKRGTKIPGCLGNATYLVTTTNKTFEKNHSKHAKSIIQNRMALLRLTAMLGEFANYSGLGIKTTQGMGIIRT